MSLDPIVQHHLDETCEECQHLLSEHSDADCDTCTSCNIDRADRLHDQAKEGPAEAPDAMDLPEDYSSRQDYGRQDARLTPFG